ncbi:M3 family metallopeptidase [Trichothermofontia sp.]
MTAAVAKIDNPLLMGTGLPPFDQIQTEHIVPAITQALAEAHDRLTHLEENFTPTWDGLMVPLQRLQDRLSWSWDIVEHLMSVKNSPELRQAHETLQPEVIKFWVRLSQSQALYRGYQQLAEQRDHLSETQQRILDTTLREAELAGVGLTGETRERFNAIQMELADLGTRFSNQVLDATKAYSLTLTDAAEIAGLPPSLLAQAAQAAREAGSPDATAENGPWRITLDMPSFMPFMQHSQRRDLRETLYRAMITRAASGEWDNQPLIDRILSLRQEMATILGFSNYAELSLSRKMAPNVAAVDELLESLRQVSYDAAVADLEALRQFAREQGAAEADDLQNWDISFWSERLREAKFAFNSEELRPYFPLNQVLNGLFDLAHHLFGVTITAADGQAPVWHPDVHYFQIADESGQPIAYFYLDAYSRPAEKRGGAWMGFCLNRDRHLENGEAKLQLPVAYLVCNQTPPVDDKPSLMTFREVETLFHEFGHGLQHMLTTVDETGAAGIRNIEWDAVELPSQFMENWCYHRSTLLSLGKHYQTGEPLPEHYYQKLLAARTFMSGTATLRQLLYAWVDLELHARYQPGGAETPHQVRDRIAQRTSVLAPLPEDRFLCSFGHIFAGGYAAGYYSYKWAEVLSADAFAAFEEAGLEDEQAIAHVGRRFRDTVLALGGSKPPMEVFQSFRGREPDTTALLRHSGLLKAA